MKFIIIFILLLLTECRAQQYWNWITPYPSGEQPLSSCQTESRIFYMTQTQSFFYTPDGGESFKVIAPYTSVNTTGYFTGSKNRIAFSDSLNGFIIYYDATYRTTDGGETWNRVLIGYHFSQIAFGSRETGWTYGTELHKTTDAGDSWIYVNSQSLSWLQGKPSLIFALNKDSLWICKDFSYHSGGVICFSYDGGTTWVGQNSIISDSSHQVSYNDLRISSDGTGFAVGRILVNDLNPHYISFIVKTSDFGNSWQSIPVDTTLNLNLVVNKNDDEWIILGSRNVGYNKIPVAIKTSDSGNSWEFHDNIFNTTSGSDDPQTAEYLISRNVLLVSGSKGIFRSMDFGETFNRLSGKNEIKVDCFALDKQPADENQLSVITSEADSFIVSTDGGRHWQKKYISSIGNFNGELAVSGGVIIAGINNDLYKSTDEGDTWIMIFRGNDPITNVVAYGNNYFTVLNGTGYHPLLNYTTDGGNRWKQISFYQYCDDLYMTGEDEFYSCGQFYDSTGTHGFISYYDNYGLDWHEIDTKERMHKVKPVSSAIALSSSDHELYRTTNSGLSWSLTLKSLEFSDKISNFAFMDSLNGLINISTYLYESQDAGLTWARSAINMPYQTDLKFMEFNKYGDLIASTSYNGMCILKNPNSNSRVQNPDQMTDQPRKYSLYQNYPNPFNPMTTIKYEIRDAGIVQLKVYDILGKEVETLVNENQPAGSHSVQFNGKGLSSGVYFYQLKAGSFTKTRKLLLIK